MQASILANTEENNMIYNIISQSSTSPFYKKSKTSIQNQGATFNTGGLLIDFSDGSKDNSSHNTPNFASPKSANAQTGIENMFKINDDLDVVPLSSLNKKSSQSKTQGNEICTQVDDFQRLIDQVTGNVAHKIIESVDINKLTHKLMTIIYYATKTSDVNDKNVNVMIDSCFDLLLPMIISYPDILIPTMYKFHNFENFIVLCLKFKGEESVRKTVSNTFKNICNNYYLNSEYTKEQFQYNYIASETKATEESKSSDSNLVKPSVPYEDPKVFFLKVLIKNLPTGGKKSDKCEELFNLLNILIKSAPSLFRYIDPYDTQNDNEEIDVPNIFSANSILTQCITEIDTRPIIEERQQEHDDKVLAGYLYLANTILQIEPKLKKYVGDPENGFDFVRKLYTFIFRMPTLEDKHSNLPKCKSKATRKRAFNLLLTLCQNDESSSTSKSSINNNFLLLFKELYNGHREMNEIESKVSYNILENIDYDEGVRNSSGFAGLRNFGATCYMNSTIQQLYMIPDFRYGILSSEVLNDDKQNSTLFQLQSIFANLQETEKKCYAPKGFTKAFKFGGEPVDVRKQQDATEFISVLSDTLETELKGTNHEKLLNEILGGEICSEIKSLEPDCEYISHTPEPFFSIQLDIKNKKNIQEALDSYIKPDILEGDNKYYCEKYDKKIKVHKRAFINKTSNVLIINLKRFEFDYTTFRRYKVNDYCEFPMTLNIKPWTREGILEKQKEVPSKSRSNSDAESQDENEKQEDENEKQEEVKQIDDDQYIYEAVGVVVHSGSAEGGHYYSYIKDRKKGKWYEFNDTRVVPFDTKDLPEETFGGEGKSDNLMGGGNDGFGEAIFSRSRNAYLIIYERKNPAPLTSVQLVNPAHEYVNGIPKSVYQHIWDENMLFMKALYFNDPDYLQFLKDYLFMNHFERKIYMNESSLTKELQIKKQIAESFGLTTITGADCQMNIESMDMFDDPKMNIGMYEEIKDTNEPFGDSKSNMEIDEIAKKDENEPDVEINDHKSDLEKLSEFTNQRSSIVDTQHIDPQVIDKAISDFLEIKPDEILEIQPNELDQLLLTNPGLWVIKFATMFALRTRHKIKDSSLYLTILQHLNSLFEINTDGCIWLLKMLTQNSQYIIDRLFEWKSDEEREHFRAVLITCISVIAKNEEKEFFDETTDAYRNTTIVEYDKNNDLFYSQKVPKSALIRFMEVFFVQLFDAARKYWKNFEDYFQVLFYFARLGYLETKYLVKSSGIYMLLDFIMNNSPPFHHGKDKPKMGSALTDVNFATPIDLLSHLIRSCVTNGIKQTESYSNVSLITNTHNHIDLPEDEIKHFMSRLCFTVDLINKQYNDSILAIVLHLCWGDYDNTYFFINELTFSCQVQKGNYNEFKKRLSIVKEILRIEDSLQEQRFELVLGLNKQEDYPIDGQSKIIDDITILELAKACCENYPYFTLKVVKIVSDLWENSTMLFYLTKNKDKIVWIRDFLDTIKLDENIEIREKLKSQNLIYDIDSSSPMVDACIESFSQVFPEGDNGFRCFQEPKPPKQEEGYEAPEQINIQDDGIFGSGGDEIFGESASNNREGQFSGADDDFKNVSRAPGQKEDVEMEDAYPDFQPGLTDEERAELDGSFN